MGKVLKMLARMNALDGLSPEAVEKLMAADAAVSRKQRMARDDEDTGWRTLENGVAVHFEDGGSSGGKKGNSKIDKGTAGMKGKTMNQVKKEAKAESKSAQKHTPQKSGEKSGFTPPKHTQMKVEKPSSGSYHAPTKLSPSFEKKSAAKRDAELEKSFKDSTGSAESIKKSLDSMKPGTVLRYNERGYSLYTKQKDGSWTYQNAYSDQVSKTDPDKIAADVLAHKDPKTGKPDPANAIKGISTPKKGDDGRNAEWDARRALANLEPNPGDAYEGKKTTLQDAQKNGAARAAGELQFPKEKGNASEEYTTVAKDASKAGVAVGKLKNGSGITSIDRGDISTANPDGMVYNTLAEHCMEDKNGNLVLTPEREKLHQNIMAETFANAEPVPKGQQKVFTMLGGGSAAGKGTIQKMMPELFNKDSPVIDADEMKKRIPEYVDCAFSPNHNEAASLAHEESSALAKRAMQAAFINGYNCTLDGTGDGSLKSMQKKIEYAQKAGYKVEGVYVTCPTDLAVERSNNRSKTDEYNRLVKEDTVRDIHSKVSHIFPKVAPLMDHVVLYDTNQPKGKQPQRICEFRNGQMVYCDEKAYQAFLDKDKEPKDK